MSEEKKEKKIDKTVISIFNSMESPYRVRGMVQSQSGINQYRS